MKNNLKPFDGSLIYSRNLRTNRWLKFNAKLIAYSIANPQLENRIYFTSGCAIHRSPTGGNIDVETNLFPANWIRRDCYFTL